MELPIKCTYERIKRLLELGFTVDTQDLYGEFCTTEPCATIVETPMEGFIVTAITPPKFKRFEVGDKVWYDGVSRRILGTTACGRNYFLEGDQTPRHHFDMLPFFEEEEEKKEESTIQIDTYYSRGEEKMYPTHIGIDGVKYKLTP